MSLPIINHICQSLLETLPNIRELGPAQKVNLEKQINKLAAEALTREGSKALTVRFGLKGFESKSVDKIPEEDIKVILSKVAKQVLVSINPTLIEKVTDVTTNRLFPKVPSSAPKSIQSSVANQQSSSSLVDYIKQAAGSLFQKSQSSAPKSIFTRLTTCPLEELTLTEISSAFSNAVASEAQKYEALVLIVEESSDRKDQQTIASLLEERLKSFNTLKIPQSAIDKLPKADSKDHSLNFLTDSFRKLLKEHTNIFLKGNIHREYGVRFFLIDFASALNAMVDSRYGLKKNKIISDSILSQGFIEVLHRYFERLQIHKGALSSLDDRLKHTIPKTFSLALTTAYQKYVAIYRLFRLSNPDKSPEAFSTELKPLLKKLNEYTIIPEDLNDQEALEAFKRKEIPQNQIYNTKDNQNLNHIVRFLQGCVETSLAHAAYNITHKGMGTKAAIDDFFKEFKIAKSKYKGLKSPFGHDRSPEELKSDKDVMNILLDNTIGSKGFNDSLIRVFEDLQREASFTV